MEDATEDVLAENPFNEPPAEGEQFLIVTLSATNDGTTEAALEGSLRFRLVGETAVPYSTFENFCGVIPDRLDEEPVAAGGSIEGNLCWAVKTADAGSLVLFDDSFDIPDEDRKFFALLPGDGPVPTPDTTITPPETPSPTSTPAITETPSEAAGTLDDPIPFGEHGLLVDGWLVKVVRVRPNATEAVLAENQFNEPPPEGEQFYMFTLSATYTGEGSAQLDATFRFRGVLDGEIVYTTFENRCGVIPNAITDGEVFAGGTVTGNVCWSVKSTDVGSLVLVDESLLAESDADRVYFALRE